MHQLYDVVTNGFTFTLRVGGKKTLNREALSAYLRSPKASLREAAYQEMYRVYEAQQGSARGKSIRPWSTTGRRKIFNCGTSRPRWPRETQQRHSRLRGGRRSSPSA